MKHKNSFRWWMWFLVPLAPLIVILLLIFVFLGFILIFCIDACCVLTNTTNPKCIKSISDWMKYE